MRLTNLCTACIGLALIAACPASPADYVSYDPIPGPGAGKKIVFLAGDEEYRPEESFPMLARILAFRYGFRTVVLFSQDKDGVIDPNVPDNIPGLDQLNDADLMVLGLRFRELPDSSMARFIGYVRSGRPIVGLRTSTHSFSYAKNPASPYARYSWASADPPGGFGRQVLGSTWVDHQGIFNVRSSQVRLRASAKGHPILKGVRDFWVPSDVYKINPLPSDAVVLADGQVLSGMRATDSALTAIATQPVAWTRDYKNEAGKDQRVVTVTHGAAADFKGPDLRRLFVNACFWAVGKEALIPDSANVDVYGAFDPAPWAENNFRKNVRPSDWAMSAPVSLAAPPPILRGASTRARAAVRRIRPDGKITRLGGPAWFSAPSP